MSSILRYCFFLPALFVAGFLLHAAPYRWDDELRIQIKEMRDSLDDLRREVNNHESEIRTYEQKVATQEDRVDAIRDEMKTSTQFQKEHLKTHHGSFESKLAGVESTHKALTADLKQIKTHAQDTQELLKTFRDKISQLEKSVEALSRNQEILQTAMNSLMDVMKVGPLDAGLKTYRVKAGDSLEKIARAHNTTIKTIKALNNLTKDTIAIDQVLKLPE